MLRRVVEVERNEERAMLMSFVFFFFLFSSYFILRPIRDEVAAASGIRQLPWLFAGTLTVTLLFTPLFAALVKKLPVRRFIPVTYHFFAANLIVFYLLFRAFPPGANPGADAWLGRAFYFWTSAFNLFVPSIFWSLMADTFRSDQAKRLFGFIGLGGTLGSVTGSAVTATLATAIGTANLLLVSVALLEIAVVVVLFMPPRFTAPADARAAAEEDARPIGGSIWAGFTHVAKSPYLMGICLFLILYVNGSTFLYFVQSDLVGSTYADREVRTAVLARLELAAQLLTVATQAFLTGRIIRWLGLGATLAILPVITMVGFGALAAMPVFMALAVFTVVRRASNFSLANPAVEILFTVVPREEKYKAKSFIETFVYRAGDQLGAWTYAGLAALGLGLVGISVVGIPIAVAFLGIALWLGRRQRELAGVTEITTRPSAAPAPAAATS